jgi:hypothetical protein
MNALHIGEETMRMGPLAGGFAISNVLLLGVLFGSSAFADAFVNEIGSMRPVPKAQCGPSDRTESALQGRTTSKERASGGSELGYSCNLALVGRRIPNSHSASDPVRPRVFSGSR